MTHLFRTLRALTHKANYPTSSIHSRILVSLPSQQVKPSTSSPMFPTTISGSVLLNLRSGKMARRWQMEPFSTEANYSAYLTSKVIQTEPFTTGRRWTRMRPSRSESNSTTSMAIQTCSRWKEFRTAWESMRTQDPSLATLPATADSPSDWSQRWLILRSLSLSIDLCVRMHASVCVNVCVSVCMCGVSVSMSVWTSSFYATN